MLGTPSNSTYRKHQSRILQMAKEFNFWKRFPPTFPRQRNWASENVFNGVRDQGNCCCCWAFVACCIIEGTLMATEQINEKVNLSPQDLLNCMHPSEKSAIQTHTGCFTSSIVGALQHIRETGVRFEDDCPYIGIKEACLSYVEVPRRLLIKNYKTLPELYNEHTIIEILRERPLGCAIALSDALLNLKEQIYIGPETKVGTTHKLRTKGSHALVVVGYGRDDTTNINYWHVMNSWGVNWGNEGFARVIRQSSMPLGSTSLLTRWCYIIGSATIKDGEIESTNVEEHVSTQAHPDLECLTSHGNTDESKSDHNNQASIFNCLSGFRHIDSQDIKNVQLLLKGETKAYVLTGSSESQELSAATLKGIPAGEVKVVILAQNRCNC